MKVIALELVAKFIYLYSEISKIKKDYFGI